MKRYTLWKNVAEPNASAPRWEPESILKYWGTLALAQGDAPDANVLVWSKMGGKGLDVRWVAYNRRQGPHARANRRPRFQIRLETDAEPTVHTAKAPANPDRDGFFRWTVQFDVHKTWVEDGFEFTDARALAMLNYDLEWAHGGELRAKVLTSPPEEAIRKVQGS